MSIAQATVTERWLKRDRPIVAITLSVFAASSWFFISPGAGMSAPTW
jgi:hypothetical protein